MLPKKKNFYTIKTKFLINAALFFEYFKEVKKKRIFLTANIRRQQY